MQRYCGDSSYDTARRKMVERQLRARGISDEGVLRAMSEVPRHLFVPDDLRWLAYDDNALPIGHGQTISQPYMLALVLSALELTGSDRVLEIGTGSGYQTALISRLTQYIYSLEIVPELVRPARLALQAAACRNVRVIFGNGSIGWGQAAPYEAIAVAAAAREVPQALLEQLAMGGRLIIPIGQGPEQDLVLVRKQELGVDRTCLGRCRFVPLVSEGGWNARHASSLNLDVDPLPPIKPRS